MNKFEKMTDEQLKRYLMRKVKKERIIKIICEEYDTYWCFLEGKKEDLINNYFEGIKSCMRDTSGHTMGEMIDHIYYGKEYDKL